MMNILWKPEYELGIASIDGQHRKIIDIINDLSDAIGDGAAHEKVLEALKRMEAYIEEHLAYEEKLFVECGFEGSEAHIREHDVFRETIREFRGRSQGNDPVIAIEMLGYLEEWFLRHILVTDRKYVEAFQSCGVK